MSRGLCKIVYPENATIKIKDKESPDGFRETTVGNERRRVREQVKGITGIHPLACERKDVRRKPYELITLKKYMGTLFGKSGKSDFIISNISSGGLQIISQTPLNIGDLVELSFILDRNYILDGKIVGGNGKIYGVKFEVGHSSLHSVQENYMNLITLLLSVDVN